MRFREQAVHTLVQHRPVLGDFLLVCAGIDILFFHVCAAFLGVQKARDATVEVVLLLLLRYLRWPGRTDQPPFYPMEGRTETARQPDPPR